MGFISFIWRVIFPAPDTREAVRNLASIKLAAENPSVAHPSYNASGLPVNDAPEEPVDQLIKRPTGGTVEGEPVGQES